MRKLTCKVLMVLLTFGCLILLGQPLVVKAQCTPGTVGCGNASPYFRNFTFYTNGIAINTLVRATDPEGANNTLRYYAGPLYGATMKTIKLGDINEDGIVTPGDAMAIYSRVGYTAAFNTYMYDLNNDKIINMADVTLAFTYAMSNQDSIPKVGHYRWPLASQTVDTYGIVKIIFEVHDRNSGPGFAYSWVVLSFSR